MKSIPLPNLYQGGDYKANINVTYQGLPLILTGYSAASQLRRQAADTDPTIDATFTCTISGSIVTISLAHTVTAALSGLYLWDLKLIDPTGAVFPIARGPAPVTSRITV